MKKKIRILLKAAKMPSGRPKWLTQRYFDRCARNKRIQQDWRPKVGDWYFCKTFNEVLQISDLDKYKIGAGLAKPSVGWSCDIYLPAPERRTRSRRAS